MTRGVLLVDMINGVRGTADAQRAGEQGGGRKALAMTQGLSNVAWIKTVLAGVNATAASVTAANHHSDTFAATAPDTSELVVKVLGIIS